jgi:hypothetical protein
MSGNYSRYSHQKNKFYSSVKLLQGAMVTDADQQEAATLSERNLTHTARMAVGSGVPAEGGILRYKRDDGPEDRVLFEGLKPGLVVADGFWGEVVATESYKEDDPVGLLIQQQGLLAQKELPEDDAHYVIYADVWDRHVGPAEDARLVDSAFLGAPTAVRSARMAQLKLLRIGDDIDPDVIPASVETALPQHGEMRLTHVVITDETSVSDPCDPCSRTVDASHLTENALFRVEVHRSDFDRVILDKEGVQQVADGQGIVLKYSRDNGGTEVAGGAAEVLREDDTLEGAVFEIFDLSAAQLKGIRPVTGTSEASVSKLELKAEFATFQQLRDMNLSSLKDKMIRVWDGVVRLDLSHGDLRPEAAGGQPVTGKRISSAGRDGFVVTLAGVELTFDLTLEKSSDHSRKNAFVLPGDAYVVEMREYADAAGQTVYFEESPVDIAHHYVFVGLYGDKQLSSKADLPTQSRHFPSLTDLQARDMRWSNHHHQDVEATTVQGAIDLLWSRDVGGETGGLCTYSIDPKQDVAAQLRAISDELSLKQDPFEQSARLCFRAGEYIVGSPVTFEGLGEVSLIGQGQEAVTLLLEEGASLTFDSLDRLSLQGLSIVSLGKVDRPEVDVFACTQVAVTGCAMRGAAGRSEDAVPIAVLDIEMGESGLSEQTVQIDRSMFMARRHRTALRIAGNGTHHVTRCQFRGDTPTRSQRAGALADWIKKIEYWPKKRPNILDGIYAVPGGGAGVWDMTRVPQYARDPLYDFFTTSLVGLEEKPLRSSADWQGQSQILQALVGDDELQDFDHLSLKAIQAEAASVKSAKGKTVNRGGKKQQAATLSMHSAMRSLRMVKPSQVLHGKGIGGSTHAGKALTDKAMTKEQIRAMRLAGKRKKRPAFTKPEADKDAPPPDKGAGFGGNVDPSVALAAAMKGVKTGKTVHLASIDANVDLSVAGAMAGAINDLSIVVRTGNYVFKRGFGIVSEPAEQARVFVQGNSFDWIRCGILVRGDRKRRQGMPFPVSGKVVISENILQRVPIVANSSNSYDGQIFAALICCEDAGNLDLERNRASQRVRDLADHNDLFPYLVDGIFGGASTAPLKDRDGFCAIELRGEIGPVLRARGNDASYFASGIYITGRPCFDLTEDRETFQPHNFWTLHENSCLPTSGGNLQAVRLADSKLPSGNLVQINMSGNDVNYPA